MNFTIIDWNKKEVGKKNEARFQFGMENPEMPSFLSSSTIHLNSSLFVGTPH